MNSVLDEHIDDLLKLIPVLGIPSELRRGGNNSILEKCCRRSPIVMYYAGSKMDDPRIMNMAIQAYRDPEKENLEGEIQGSEHQDDARALLESMSKILLDFSYVVEAYHLGMDLGMENIVDTALGRVFEKVRLKHPEDMRKLYEVKEIAADFSYEEEYLPEGIDEESYDRENSNNGNGGEK